MIEHYKLHKEEYDRLQEQYRVKADEIVDAIHCPEMTPYEPWMIRHMWVHAPNYWADYWTVGYRLERNNATMWGHRSPTKLIEVYYAKIAQQFIDDPEWLPKFAGEFKTKYYAQLDKLRPEDRVK